MWSCPRATPKPRARASRGLRRALLGLLLCLGALVPPNATGQTADTRVDVALVLAIDCSWSVDGGEFALQVRGLSQALASPAVARAIRAGRHGRIAVKVVQWAGPGEHVVAVPWTVVDGAASAGALADRVAAQSRRIPHGATSIASMIDFAVFSHLRSPFRADRHVIDISADGENNTGPRVERARDRAAALGMTINGLPILHEVRYLDHWFRNRVIGGPGAFVEVAHDYVAFEVAMRRKLTREILGPIS